MNCIPFSPNSDTALKTNVCCTFSFETHFCQKKIYLSCRPTYHVQYSSKKHNIEMQLKLVMDFFSGSHSGYYFCRYWCLWILAYIRFGFGFALVNPCLLRFRNPQWSGGTSEVIWGQYNGWSVVILGMMVVLYIM